MLTALVLICSTDNAAAVMRMPVRFRSPATCFMYGRAYLTEKDGDSVATIESKLSAREPKPSASLSWRSAQNNSTTRTLATWQEKPRLACGSAGQSRVAAHPQGEE